MAIDKKFQNSGYGSILFNKMTESFSSKEMGMFLEVEIPTGDDSINCNKYRRIKFYERLGAKKLDINYVLPNIEGGLPMYLYFRPSLSMKILPKDTLIEAIRTAFKYIHSDLMEWEKTFNSFSNEIHDVYFT